MSIWKIVNLNVSVLNMFVDFYEMNLLVWGK